MLVRPDIAQGFVQAECIEDALVKLSDDRANVYPLPEGFVWPVEAGAKDVWFRA